MNFYEMLNILENSSQYLNLLTNRQAVLAAFELMEDPSTFQDSLKSDRDSMRGAIEWLDAKDSRPFPDEGSYTIYGSGGFNRYFVRPNGDIEFSSMHAMYPSKQTIQKARDLGFKIFPK